MKLLINDVYCDELRMFSIGSRSFLIEVSDEDSTLFKKLDRGTVEKYLSIDELYNFFSAEQFKALDCKDQIYVNVHLYHMKERHKGSFVVRIQLDVLVDDEDFHLLPWRV